MKNVDQNFIFKPLFKTSQTSDNQLDYVVIKSNLQVAY